MIRGAAGRNQNGPPRRGEGRGGVELQAVAEAVADGAALIGSDGVIRWSSARLGGFSGRLLARAAAGKDRGSGEQDHETNHSSASTASQISPALNGLPVTRL